MKGLMHGHGSQMPAECLCLASGAKPKAGLWACSSTRARQLLYLGSSTTVLGNPPPSPLFEQTCIENQICRTPLTSPNSAASEMSTASRSL